jgi:hypothetical protein
VANFKQPLRLFLVYALVWPITLGDRMVHLDAPTAEQAAYSSPWTFYRNLGRSIFGEAVAPLKVAAAMRVHSRYQPPASFPISKPGAASTTPSIRSSDPVRREPILHPRPVPPLSVPPPPLALQVDSKE